MIRNGKMKLSTIYVKLNSIRRLIRDANDDLVPDVNVEEAVGDIWDAEEEISELMSEIGMAIVKEDSQ